MMNEDINSSLKDSPPDEDRNIQERTHNNRHTRHNESMHPGTNRRSYLVRDYDQTRGWNYQDQGGMSNIAN